MDPSDPNVACGPYLLNHPEGNGEKKLPQVGGAPLVRAIYIKRFISDTMLMIDAQIRALINGSV